MFDMLIPKDREYLANFDWDINSSPQQRLYLSQDTRRLMEVVNGYIGTVYTRSNVDDLGKTIMIEN